MASKTIAPTFQKDVLSAPSTSSAQTHTASTRGLSSKSSVSRNTALLARASRRLNTCSRVRSSTRCEASPGARGAKFVNRAVAEDVEAEASAVSDRVRLPVEDTRTALPRAEVDKLYKAYSKGYRNAPVDVECSEFIADADIEGAIPEDLVGTLLRNGPALFERTDKEGKKKSRVYLDGDGMVFSLAMKDGKAYFRNKFVRTDSFVREQEAGTFLDLSIFTKEDPRAGPDTGPTPLFRLRDDIFNGPPSPKANGAYNVVNWAGSLCAVDWGRPHALSDSLDYEGRREGDEFSNSDFTAHYRVLTEADGSKRMVTFEPKVDWAKGITTTTFKEFDEAGHCVSSKEHVFPATYFHDMIVTENFYVLFDCPVKMDLMKTFIGYPFGLCSLGETISEDLSKRGVFRIFPRRDNGFKPQVIEADKLPSFAFHHINGYDMLNATEDKKSNKIVFETCTWDRMCLYFNDIIKSDGEKFWPRTRLSRFVMDLDTETCERTIVSDGCCEYPVVAQSATGVPHTYSYLVSAGAWFEDPQRGQVNGPMQVLEKLTYEYEADGTTIRELRREPWSPGPMKFAMEPLFVARPNAQAEDDGYLVVPVYNAETEKSEVAILDAMKWHDPLVANVKLPCYIPFGVHGSFSDEYICGPDQA